MARPQQGEHGEFYQKYIDKTNGDSVESLVADHSAALNIFINNLPESKADFAYAEGKWTIKDLLQHIIDTERIMSYRALTFARKDAQNLPGFEEDTYAIAANAGNRSLQSLKDEFVALRKATDLFLLSLSEEQLQQTGKANGHSVKVNSIAFMLFGHALHHKHILEERYL
jgi:uncharacterized damage-inducible protein DinB